MAILQMVWFWELTLLVRKSERTNNLDLFFSCCRMSMILFTTSNATEYSRIMGDFLTYWHTCSDFEKALIRSYGFTLVSPNGVIMCTKSTLDSFETTLEKLVAGDWRQGWNTQRCAE